jgi:ribonuclease Z
LRRWTRRCGHFLLRALARPDSTAVEAARVALAARARRLVLTHLSARYSKDSEALLNEARAVFPETVVATDGMEIDVPYVGLE